VSDGEIFPPDLIVDILDILIVSYLLYRLFSLMRGTRAVHMFFGLIVLFILSVIAQWVNIDRARLDHLQPPDGVGDRVRSSSSRSCGARLAMMGQNPVLSRFVSVQESRGVVPEIIKAVASMSEKRIGALIVLEKDMGLKKLRGKRGRR